MNYKFSVVIPLYNKRQEIEGTVRSVLAQSYAPHEIIVVDDGSTDGSGEIVESIGSPKVRLVRQTNAGECAARNRGIAEATGEYIALLDADDSYLPEFLEHVVTMIERWPDCGAYATGFYVTTQKGDYLGRTPDREGIVDDFFRTSMTRFVCTASSVVIPRSVFDAAGGFPDGMALGGDQFMWIKIATLFPVCFSPRPLARYFVAAANRSAAIYRSEKTKYSFQMLLSTDDFWRNEFIARVALGKALTISSKGGTQDAAAVLRDFAFNRHSRRTWWKLRILNSLPPSWRLPLHRLYNKMAWAIAKKGM